MSVRGGLLSNRRQRWIRDEPDGSASQNLVGSLPGCECSSAIQRSVIFFCFFFLLAEKTHFIGPRSSEAMLGLAGPCALRPNRVSVSSQTN